MNIQKYKYLLFIYLFGLFLQSPYLLRAQDNTNTPEHETKLKISYLMRNIIGANGGDAVSAINNILPKINEALKIKVITALVLLDKNPEEAYPVFERYVAYGYDQESDDNSAWFVRAICALSLAQINNKKILPKIRHLYLNEPNNLTQRSLLFALGEMKDNDAVDLIIRQLEVTKDEATAIYGIIALGKIGNKKATETLVRYTIGNYLNLTQKTAGEALKKINWSEKTPN